MNEDNKELVRKYADHLKKEALLFLMKNIEPHKEYNVSPIINIVLSAHLSACFETMKVISSSSDNPEVELAVLKFISEFENVLPKMPFIEKVEFSDSKSE